MAKRGIFEHPKTLMLAGALGLEPWMAVGLLEALWHWTAKYGPDGIIGGYSNQIIASGIGWHQDADELVMKLIEHEWLDHVEGPGRLAIHDWADHIDNTTKKFLERNGKTAYKSDGQVQIPANIANVQTSTPKNGSNVQTLGPKNGGDVQKNGQKTGGHVQPRARLNQTIPNLTIPNPCASVEKQETQRTDFDEAWAEFERTYPPGQNSGNSGSAKREFKRLYLASADLTDILNGVKRYRRFVEAKGWLNSQFVKGMLGWLKDERWKDDFELPPDDASHPNAVDWTKVDPGEGNRPPEWFKARCMPPPAYFNPDHPEHQDAIRKFVAKFGPDFIRRYVEVPA